MDEAPLHTGVDTMAYSRPLATADRLGQHAPDRHRFLGKSVLLTGDPGVLATANGRVMALTALRLLPRLTPNVLVWIPGSPEALANELRAEAKRIAFGGRISVIGSGDPGETPVTTADAVLSIGRNPEAHDGAPEFRPLSAVPMDRWTTIASNGWCVWVGRGALPGAIATTQTNPVGAVAAASLGVAEVFKIFIALKSDRGAPADGMPFSLFTYRIGNSDPGPHLPDRFDIDALIIGVGAIGNGLIATLAELPLWGRIVVIDRQTYGPENLGTCILVGPHDVGTEKPTLARAQLAHLESTLTVESRFGDAERVIADVQPVPAVVLNGLDNPRARREAQRLWADVTIDGAIGDFMCQVSRHPGDPDVDTACLRCLFPEETGPSAEAIASAATGLRPERTLVDDVVREEDVLAAPEHHREALRAQLGKPICSVTSAAVARTISSVEQPDSFEPSVPFVATCSAAMVVGEWIKAAMHLASPLDPRFQFDILHGPGAGLEFPESRHADCQCVQRRGTISRVRASRRR